MLPFLWLFLEIDANGREALVEDQFFTVLFLVICAGVMICASYYRKIQNQSASRLTELNAKMEAYFRVQVVTFLILEGAAIMATLAFYFTASYLFVLAYFFILFLFSVARPTLDRVSRNLMLSKDEITQLKDQH